MLKYKIEKTSFSEEFKITVMLSKVKYLVCFLGKLSRKESMLTLNMKRFVRVNSILGDKATVSVSLFFSLTNLNSEYGF